MQSFTCSTLRSTIKFKYMIALIDKTQIVLSFLRTINFNAIICLNLFEKPNITLKFYPLIY